MEDFYAVSLLLSLWRSHHCHVVFPLSPYILLLYISFTPIYAHCTWRVILLYLRLSVILCIVCLLVFCFVRRWCYSIFFFTYYPYYHYCSCCCHYYYYYYYCFIIIIIIIISLLVFLIFFIAFCLIIAQVDITHFSCFLPFHQSYLVFFVFSSTTHSIHLSFLSLLTLYTVLWLVLSYFQAFPPYCLSLIFNNLLLACSLIS